MFTVMNLSEKHKKQLRKLGHSLKPVVIIADQGLKETVIAATNEALDAHELIKVRLRAGDRDERKQILESLTEQTAATLVGQIGFTALLFRRNRKKPKIDFAKRS